MRAFLSFLLALALAPAAVAKPTDAAAEAFLKGVEHCSSEFLHLQMGQSRGLDRGIRGFAPAPDEAGAPGVRSLHASFPEATILRAKLPAGAPGAVYVLIGVRGSLPLCQTLAVDAPNAGEAALRWFEEGNHAFRARRGEDRTFGLVQRLYVRTSKRSNIGVGATLTTVEGAPLGSMTALSTMSFGRED